MQKKRKDRKKKNEARRRERSKDEDEKERRKQKGKKEEKNTEKGGKKRKSKNKKMKKIIKDKENELNGTDIQERQPRLPDVQETAALHVAKDRESRSPREPSSVALGSRNYRSYSYSLLLKMNK